MKYQFTREDRVKGGKARAAMPNFSEHCQYAYLMLQLKRPGVALFIYRQKIAPYMEAKQQKGEVQ